MILLLAHPFWPDRGLAWIEALDNIDLIYLATKAKANRKAVPKRQAMAAMCLNRLCHSLPAATRLGRFHSSMDQACVSEDHREAISIE